MREIQAVVLYDLLRSGREMGNSCDPLWPWWRLPRFCVKKKSRLDQGRSESREFFHFSAGVIFTDAALVSIPHAENISVFQIECRRQIILLEDSCVTVRIPPVCTLHKSVVGWSLSQWNLGAGFISGRKFPWGSSEGLLSLWGS